MASVQRTTPSSACDRKLTEYEDICVLGTHSFKCLSIMFAAFMAAAVAVFWSIEEQKVQGDTSGCSLGFIDIKTKVEF